MPKLPHYQSDSGNDGSSVESSVTDENARAGGSLNYSHGNETKDLVTSEDNSKTLVTDSQSSKVQVSGTGEGTFEVLAIGENPTVSKRSNSSQCNETKDTGICEENSEVSVTSETPAASESSNVSQGNEAFDTSENTTIRKCLNNLEYNETKGSGTDEENSELVGRDEIPRMSKPLNDSHYDKAKESGTYEKHADDLVLDENSGANRSLSHSSSNETKLCDIDEDISVESIIDGKPNLTECGKISDANEAKDFKTNKGKSADSVCENHRPVESLNASHCNKAKNHLELKDETERFKTVHNETERVGKNDSRNWMESSRDIKNVGNEINELENEEDRKKLTVQKCKSSASITNSTKSKFQSVTSLIHKRPAENESVCLSKGKCIKSDTANTELSYLRISESTDVEKHANDTALEKSILHKECRTDILHDNNSPAIDYDISTTGQIRNCSVEEKKHSNSTLLPKVEDGKPWTIISTILSTISKEVSTFEPKTEEFLEKSDEMEKHCDNCAETHNTTCLDKTVAQKAKKIYEEKHLALCTIPYNNVPNYQTLCVIKLTGNPTENSKRFGGKAKPNNIPEKDQCAMNNEEIGSQATQSVSNEIGATTETPIFSDKVETHKSSKHKSKTCQSNAPMGCKTHSNHKERKHMCSSNVIKNEYEEKEATNEVSAFKTDEAITNIHENVKKGEVLQENIGDMGSSNTISCSENTKDTGLCTRNNAQLRNALKNITCIHQNTKEKSDNDEFSFLVFEALVNLLDFVQGNTESDKNLLFCGMQNDNKLQMMASTLHTLSEIASQESAVDDTVKTGHADIAKHALQNNSQVKNGKEKYSHSNCASKENCPKSGCRTAINVDICDKFAPCNSASGKDESENHKTFALSESLKTQPIETNKQRTSNEMLDSAFLYDKQEIPRIALNEPGIPVNKEKTILLLGASGSGKTTLVKLIASFCAGIESPEDYLSSTRRLQIESMVNQNDVTLYTAYPEEGHDINVNIIDTPGLNDSSGENIQHRVNALQNFLGNVSERGLEIHAIGFVVQAHMSRLTPSEELVMKYVRRHFKENSTHIIPIITFADSQKAPPVLKAMQHCNLTIENYFLFNNSVLSLDDVDEISDIDRAYWRKGLRNWKKICKFLEKSDPVAMLNVKGSIQPKEQSTKTHKSEEDKSMKTKSDAVKTKTPTSLGDSDQSKEKLTKEGTSIDGSKKTKGHATNAVKKTLGKNSKKTKGQSANTVKETRRNISKKTKKPATNLVGETCSNLAKETKDQVTNTMKETKDQATNTMKETNENPTNVMKETKDQATNTMKETKGENSEELKGHKSVVQKMESAREMNELSYAIYKFVEEYDRMRGITSFINELREEVWKKAMFVYPSLLFNIPFDTWLYSFTRDVCNQNQNYSGRHNIFLTVLALSKSRPLVNIGRGIILNSMSMYNIYSQRSIFSWSPNANLLMTIESEAQSHIQNTIIENNVSEFMNCYEFLCYLTGEVEPNLCNYIHTVLLRRYR